MVLSASVLAGVHVSAVLDTVVAPLGADVVWDGLRVFGYIGGNVVGAHTAESESLGIAIVGNGVQLGDAGLLKADEGALRLLVPAPCISVGFANSLGINGILSSRKASQGNNGESKDGTHVDDMCVCFEDGEDRYERGDW